MLTDSVQYCLSKYFEQVDLLDFVDLVLAVDMSIFSSCQCLLILDLGWSFPLLKQKYSKQELVKQVRSDFVQEPTDFALGQADYFDYFVSYYWMVQKAEPMGWEEESNSSFTLVCD